MKYHISFEGIFVYFYKVYSCGYLPCRQLKTKQSMFLLLSWWDNCILVTVRSHTLTVMKLAHRATAVINTEVTKMLKKLMMEEKMRK